MAVTEEYFKDTFLELFKKYGVTDMAGLIKAKQYELADSETKEALDWWYNTDRGWGDRKKNV